LHRGRRLGDLRPFQDAQKGIDFFELSKRRRGSEGGLLLTQGHSHACLLTFTVRTLHLINSSMSNKTVHPGWGGRRPGAGRKKIYKDSKESKKAANARSYMRKKGRESELVLSDFELPSETREALEIAAQPESLEYQVLVALLNLKHSPTSSSASSPHASDSESSYPVYLPSTHGDPVAAL
jgi:hypothetical protein